MPISALLLLVLWLPSLAWADSVTLAWMNPTVNADGTPLEDLATITVHYGTRSKTYAISADVGQVQSALVKGLLPGTTYYFAVTARDTSGNVSGYSNEVTHTIPGTPVDPVDPILPTVRLVKPINGTQVARGATVEMVAATATTSGLKHVSFVVNGRRVSMDTTAPYSYRWRAPATRGTYTLTARAVPLSGQYTTSAPIRVSVR